MRRHSPYNFAFDNPIFFIDPDGMAPTPHAVSAAQSGNFASIGSAISFSSTIDPQSLAEGTTIIDAGGGGTIVSGGPSNNNTQSGSNDSNNQPISNSSDRNNYFDSGEESGVQLRNGNRLVIGVNGVEQVEGATLTNDSDYIIYFKPGNKNQTMNGETLDVNESYALPAGKSFKGTVDGFTAPHIVPTKIFKIIDGVTATVTNKGLDIDLPFDLTTFNLNAQSMRGGWKGQSWLNVRNSDTNWAGWGKKPDKSWNSLFSRIGKFPE